MEGMDLSGLLQPIVLLVASLFILVRGADIFVDGAKQLGAYLGMGSFAIGVLIVGLGTSLPELASSLAAVLAGSSEIVVANAVGSNITNILLIVGLLATVGGTVVIKKNLLDSELPIFLISTVHFIAAVHDGVIDRIEGVLLVGTFIAYLWYVRADVASGNDFEPVRAPTKLGRAVVLAVAGVTAVLVGAHYTVASAVSLASELMIPLGLVSIAAIAIGTSLPELFVSLRALKTGEAELAIGNIFGSNAFNILMVVGLPALIMPLQIDVVVMELGIWIMLGASVIFLINGLARRVMQWEGVMMLLFFAFFMVKLFDFIG